eukprot:11182946-Lingulodinium_polyedra.AAC.1
MHASTMRPVQRTSISSQLRGNWPKTAAKDGSAARFECSVQNIATAGPRVRGLFAPVVGRKRVDLPMDRPSM